MTHDELLILADTERLITKEKPLKANDGRIAGNRIAIRKDIETTAEKSCVLVEELGHYYTSSGNIINQHDISNRKQEHKARLMGYEIKIGLSGIIDCYKHGCQSVHDIAEFLEAPEEYIRNVIECYKSKYGLHVQHDNYLIIFHPSLAVVKLIYNTQTKEKNV